MVLMRLRGQRVQRSVRGREQHLLLLHGLRGGLQVLQGRQAAGAAAAAAECGNQAGGLLRGHGASAAGVAAGVLLGHEGFPQQALQHLDQGALVVLLRPRPPQRLQRPRQPHLHAAGGPTGGKVFLQSRPADG